MSGGVLSLSLLLGAAAVAPHLLARDALRSRLVRFDALSTATLLALWYIGNVAGLRLSAGVACGVVLVVKIVLLSGALIREAESDELLFTPGRAALFAGLVYLALIPAVLSWPIDGDEAFYVLQAESILQDGDLDLSNQYAELSTSQTGRLDLRPQFGDPVGEEGQLYSRHEPLLSLLLIPGLLAGGLAGAVATIAILAALAVRAVIALLLEEEVGTRARVVVWAFIAFGPPFINYATRIWPEAPGALMMAEILRAARAKQYGRLLVAGVLMSALKIRFIPIVAIVLLLTLLVGRVSTRRLLAGLAAVAVAIVALYAFFPGVVEARMFDPRTVFMPDNFARGLLGILVDAQAGLLFQAPMLLVGLGALFRWRGLGNVTRLGCLAALPYLVLLLPRSEWHGGWSPPLRYLVVFMPVFALLVAEAVDRVIGATTLVITAAWTAGLTACGVAFPPGLFRIASGESLVGEHLSRLWSSDFSRLLPSLIRPDEAAKWFAAAVLVVAAIVAFRRWRPGENHAVIAAVMSIVVVAGAWAGMEPGHVVELEDAHVEKRGGELYPEQWTVARFRFRGGWTLMSGDEIEFRHSGGVASLSYYCDQPTVIEIDGTEMDVPTGRDYGELVIELPETEESRHVIRCVKGALIVDRLASH